jgi:SLAP domain-containing protein
MKKIIALLLALTLTLSLCACGTSTSRDRDDDRETEHTKGSSLADPISPTGNGEISGDPTNSQTQAATANQFINMTNFAEDPGSVSIKPCRVYWENGVLVAECFVINGLDKAVHNIEVKSLAFGNKEFQIASAYFGMLQDLTIAPHSYVTWTFYFENDCVITPDADLSYLNCDASTSYYY